MKTPKMTPIDGCPGCAEPWNGPAGAFGCGYPLADCGAMIEPDEDGLVPMGTHWDGGTPEAPTPIPAPPEDIPF